MNRLNFCIQIGWKVFKYENSLVKWIFFIGWWTNCSGVIERSRSKSWQSIGSGNQLIEAEEFLLHRRNNRFSFEIRSICINHNFIFNSYLTTLKTFSFLNLFGNNIRHKRCHGIACASIPKADIGCFIWCMKFLS